MALEELPPWAAQALGTTIGGVLSIVGGLAAQRMTTRREREARRHEVEERRSQKRADFQAATLIELQESLIRCHELGRFAYGSVRAMSERRPIHAFEERLTKWESDSSKLVALIVRVDDERIRSLSNNLFHEVNASLRHAKANESRLSVEQINCLLDAMADTFNATNQRIGEVLRGLGGIVR